MILYTGANTPFTGFPFLASFVAEDSFLPRQLTRRGHRLAFSNGIIVLTVAAHRAVADSGRERRPPGAVLRHRRVHRIHHGRPRDGQVPLRRGASRDWRRRLVINFAAGIVSLLVVVIFAVVKFTEGAWLVVILFPIGWFALVRLNEQYREEQHALDLVTAAAGRVDTSAGTTPGTSCSCFVDRLDLAVTRALRYAGSLRPTEIRAVHLMIDSDVAEELEAEWVVRGLGDRVPLTVVECPDRRLIRAASELALGVVVQDRAEVTALLPRRTFRRLSQRLLHDRTADRIATALGRIPHVSATIVPFDTTLSPEVERRLERTSTGRRRRTGPAIHQRAYRHRRR